MLASIRTTGNRQRIQLDYNSIEWALMLGLKAGSKLQIRIEGNRLVVEKKVALDLTRWVGKAVDDGLSRDEALAELRGRAVPWHAETTGKDSKA